MSVFGLKQMIKIVVGLLEDQDIWDLVTAFRGVDADSFNLKWIFTARIRYLAGHRDATLYLRDKPTIGSSNLSQALIEAENMDLTGLDHYLTHMEKALIVLHKAGLIDSEEYNFLRELSGFILEWATSLRYKDEDIKSTTVDTLIAKWKKFIEAGTYYAPPQLSST